MEKMKMHSMSKIDENVKKIAALFPECITEIINDNGELEKVVDIDAFKQLFSKTAVEGNQERYQFTWPDKRKAKALVNQEVTSTLRPCREESVNFDTTENLYIEGDNLEVLKLLQETYLGKIKMIYIDPPYNTGNDFLYNDLFYQDSSSYQENSGQIDFHGNRLTQNLESNGRFHTDWLNMMYPRMKLAKDLLSNDGVIFISIDDCEQSNLKRLCDEIFGEASYVATLHCQMSTTQGMKVKAAQNGNIVKNAEYVLCYSKDGHQNIAKQPLYDLRPEYDEHYSLILREDGTIGQLKELYDYRFPKDVGTSKPLSLAEAYKRSEEFAEIVRSHLAEIVRSDKVSNVNLDDLNIQNGCWKIVTHNDREYILTRDMKGNLKQLLRLSDSWGTTDGYYHESGLRKIRGDWWDGFYIDMGNVSKEGDMNFANGKKPVRLISQLVRMVTGTNPNATDIILDFFSGSATTAHAVMQQNSEDGGHRKFIMVQLPEACDEKSEAYKTGYQNICEIGKERIRRAGKQILADMKNKKGELFAEEATLDIGFRDLKLDSSNMNDVYYTPDSLGQDMLDGLVSNIKEDRTAEDLLFQVMLDLGVLLSAKIDKEQIGGKEVFNINNNYLIACFDENVTEDVIVEIAKRHPDYFVMRDSSLATDSVSVNFDQIFERYEETKTNNKTVRKIL